MKVVLKNVNLEFAVNDREEVSMKFGNDVQGMILHSLLTPNGGVATSQVLTHAVTPYINIENIVSNIVITHVFSPYDGQVQVSFYSDSNTESFISSLTGPQSYDQPQKTINLGSIPAGAKYLRFNATNGSEQASTASNASTITFVRSIE